MRLFALMLLTCPLLGEFLEVRIHFDDGGCLSCAQSLEQRLGRVRGVEAVVLDLEERVVSLTLEEGNRVRLLPLLSRVEQGGAETLDVRFVARGSVSEKDDRRLFQPSGLTRVYRLEGAATAPADAVLVQGEVIDADEGVLRVAAKRKD